MTDGKTDGFRSKGIARVSVGCIDKQPLGQLMITVDKIIPRYDSFGEALTVDTHDHLDLTTLERRDCELILSSITHTVPVLKSCMSTPSGFS